MSALKEAMEILAEDSEYSHLTGPGKIDLKKGGKFRLHTGKNLTPKQLSRNRKSLHDLHRTLADKHRAWAGDAKKGSEKAKMHANRATFHDNKADAHSAALRSEDY